MDLGWAESAFPLAGKVEGRVGLLKGYGNAIVPQVAAAFLREIFDIVGVAP
jgi:DNA (cytosine-5)-methyltransferase 1